MFPKDIAREDAHWWPEPGDLMLWSLGGKFVANLILYSGRHTKYILFNESGQAITYEFSHMIFFLKSSWTIVKKRK